jgi:aminoglycoside phosphotransferase family enzyme
VCLEPVAAILEFYRSRRILRRAKIAIWHLREPDSPRRQRYADRARRYLEIARPWVG